MLCLRGNITSIQIYCFRQHLCEKVTEDKHSIIYNNPNLCKRLPYKRNQSKHIVFKWKWWNQVKWLEKKNNNNCILDASKIDCRKNIMHPKLMVCVEAVSWSQRDAATWFVRTADQKYFIRWYNVKLKKRCMVQSLVNDVFSFNTVLKR